MNICRSVYNGLKGLGLSNKLIKGNILVCTTLLWTQPFEYLLGLQLASVCRIDCLNFLLITYYYSNTEEEKEEDPSRSSINSCSIRWVSKEMHGMF